MQEIHLWTIAVTIIASIITIWYGFWGAALFWGLIPGCVISQILDIKLAELYPESIFNNLISFSSVIVTLVILTFLTGIVPLLIRDRLRFNRCAKSSLQWVCPSVPSCPPHKVFKSKGACKRCGRKLLPLEYMLHEEEFDIS